MSLKVVIWPRHFFSNQIAALLSEKKTAPALFSFLRRYVSMLKIIPSALQYTFWEAEMCTAGQKVLLTITDPGLSF